MGARYYLKAYLAGIATPTVFLLLFVSGFTVARHLWEVPGPAERVIIFPMAILPNLWGVWNVLLAWTRRRRPVSSGAFGAMLPLIVAPIAYLITRIAGVELPPFLVRVFPMAFVTVVGVYYLLWKYVVQFLNDLVETG